MNATKDIYQSSKYNPHEIEPKWQQQWREDNLYEVDLNDESKPKYYFLTMYPYPSGDLHAGHWYAEAPADAAARYRRMKGYNVLFPMGFDAFGLPAENAAIKHKTHPKKWTYDNIERMTKQFSQMGAMFDWSKKVITSDPEYYKWNQWLFLQFYKQGLAYKKLSPVDWCPGCNTTLAREQVITEERVCERCGTAVIKKDLEQWYLKITNYADELLDFSNLDWPDKVRLMQTNWIGRSEGAEVAFKTEAGDIRVFTTRPDTLWGATFLVLAPEHPLVEKLTTADRNNKVVTYIQETKRKAEIERQAEGKEKTGVFIGAYATNPVNGERTPIWIADYVLMSYGTGAIMAVPAHDQRDFEFAYKFNLPIKVVIQPENTPLDVSIMSEAYTDDGVMANSGHFDGTPAGKEGHTEGIAKVIAYLEEEGIGEKQITYRLHDWLISRQRYWGTPIPIIYCRNCGTVPVAEDDLPVALPEDVEFMPTGESPLRFHKDFLNVTCPNCHHPAKRDSDTMDTFIDSSWYWFRYLSPNKDNGPFDKNLAKQWMPVEQYTGGIEHAILHLLYARFFTKVMRDLGLTTVSEPFSKLRNQGIILGEDNEKMSKSRGNVVNPDDLVAEYGADAVRAYLMFIGPWDQGGPWNSKGIEGITRFLNRSWHIILDEAKKGSPANKEVAQNKGFFERFWLRFKKENNQENSISPLDSEQLDKELAELRFATHKAIKEVSEDLENFQFNTAIAELMTLLNAMQKAKNMAIAKTSQWQETCKIMVTMLSPFVPHIAEELWQRIGYETSVHLEKWPNYDANALVKDTITIAVQINGKVRAEIAVPANSTKEQILAIAKAEENVLKHIEGKEIKREIVVPNKLINIVY